MTICDILDCSPVARELESQGAEVLPLETDVTNEQDTMAMATRTVARFGRIDILINNAAIYGGIENKNFVRPFDEIAVSDWDKMMAVNVKGMWLCCKAVAPQMKKQGYGKIVNIASTGPWRESPYSCTTLLPKAE